MHVHPSQIQQQRINKRIEETLNKLKRIEQNQFGTGGAHTSPSRALSNS
jgi:hypothetical protein